MKMARKAYLFAFALVLSLRRRLLCPRAMGVRRQRFGRARATLVERPHRASGGTVAATATATATTTVALPAAALLAPTALLLALTGGRRGGGGLGSALLGGLRDVAGRIELLVDGMILKGVSGVGVGVGVGGGVWEGEGEG